MKCAHYNDDTTNTRTNKIRLNNIYKSDCDYTDSTLKLI